MTSAMSEYPAGHPIELAATLVYTGPAASVEIWHAHQTVGFGVAELFGGNVRPVFAFSCESTKLERGKPLVVPFTKTGGTLTPDPSFNAFMDEPVLRLPSGAWHVYAQAEFSESSCTRGMHSIRAEIEVTVAGAAATATQR
jgi:hypothetical protein